MKKLKLTRVGEFDDATLGVLSVDSRPICVTLEDLWKENEKMVSCIPKGKYEIEWHTSPKFGECYILKNVPNRSHILIHAGNTAADTHGCILLGLMFNTVSKRAAIQSSRAAIDVFNLYMNKEPAILEVV